MDDANITNNHYFTKNNMTLIFIIIIIIIGIGSNLIKKHYITSYFLILFFSLIMYCYYMYNNNKMINNYDAFKMVKEIDDLDLMNYKYIKKDNDLINILYEGRFLKNYSINDFYAIIFNIENYLEYYNYLKSNKQVLDSKFKSIDINDLTVNQRHIVLTFFRDMIGIIKEKCDYMLLMISNDINVLNGYKIFCDKLLRRLLIYYHDILKNEKQMLEINHYLTLDDMYSSNLYKDYLTMF